LQLGPIGLAPVTGRVCTRISYSYRSTVHDLLLPSWTATPQVSYIPQTSDLPVYSGHPVKVSGSETYKELWTNIKMVSLKNTSYDEKTVTIGYRTSGTTYTNLSLALPPESHTTFLTASGLTTTGIGLEENLRLYCATVAGDIFLSKSYFAVVPYKIHRGPLKAMYDLHVINTNASLFGEQMKNNNNFTVQLDTGVQRIVSVSDCDIKSSYVPSMYDYAITLERPVNDNYGTNDYDVVTHKQFRYPLSFSYLLSVK